MSRMDRVEGHRHEKITFEVVTAMAKRSIQDLVSLNRPRRMRINEPMRRMVRDIRLSRDDLIAPLFVTLGQGVREEITSMPGQFQLSVDQVVGEAEAIYETGIPAVILFGIPESKDAVGSGAYDDNGVIQQAIRAIKGAVPELIVIADTCLCEYTDHGHCGLLNDATAGIQINESLPQSYLLNDETLQLLNRIAISQAAAGADVIAPSGMIDSMVGSIRQALDEHQFGHVAIMSYSVKYASSFYGPFRDAADGAPQFGDRKTHQMDPANKKHALLEAQLDVDEGTDMLMVKPALAYLDVIHQLKDRFPQYPLVAYNVSGEYSMIKAAAAKGWLDERSVVMESLTSMKRAGADLIITYHAKDVCDWLES